jgi:hypothetical protein
MLEHGWTSWRDEWTAADVEKALAYADLQGWTFDHWSDGDMQFMNTGPVLFDDLAKLRIAFTPRSMRVAATVDHDAQDAQDQEWESAGADPLQRQSIPLMVLVTMSWNVTVDSKT